MSRKASNDDERWLTVAEAADVHGVSERAIVKRIQAGAITARREGRRWLVLAGAGSGELFEELSRGYHAYDYREKAGRYRARAVDGEREVRT